MDVRVLSTLNATLRLLPPDAGPEALETHGNFVPMEQDDVSDCARVDSEEGTVYHAVGGAEVSGRVVHVLLVVVEPSIVQSSADIVQLAEMVINSVRINW